MRPCFQRCIGKTAWTVPQDSPAEQDTRGGIAVQCVHSRQNRGGSMQKQSAEWQTYAAHFEFKQMLIWKHFGKLCPIHSVHLAVDTYWYYIVSIYRFFIKKSTETGRTNFFHTFRQNSRGSVTNHISIGLFPTSSRYAFKNSAARLLGRISGNKAQCPLLPVLFQSMPYRMLYAKRNFFEYSFHLYNNFFFKT